MLDISKAFATSSETVIGFFQEPGLGFYIPLYQREYSWDSENIEQLMEDVCQGVENLLDHGDEIHFLGTILRVKEDNPQQNINPQDPRAFPTRIDNVIDGQQRISTIALLGTLIYRRLHLLDRKFPSEYPFNTILTEIIPSKLRNLLELFSVDLRRGTPSKKPIVIRGSVDRWTLDETLEDHYESPVAKYLMSVLRAIHNREDIPRPPGEDGSRKVAANLRLMDRWLSAIENSHLSLDDDGLNFPPAWTLLERISENHIWDYPRNELRDIVFDEDEDSPEKSALCSLTQLLVFSHYLLDRCCFTVIDPVSKDWAFDMFQSLNATGTPLTAIETFRPMVVNVADASDGGFAGSRIQAFLSDVDILLQRENSAAQKAKLTNEFLTAFAYAHDGTKLSRRFSQQRKWLERQYAECTDNTARENFVRNMSDVAIYLKEILDFDHEEIYTLPGLGELSKDQKELATFCVLYLQDAGHKMAHTLLCRFYSNVRREATEASVEFLAACKAIVAFYTLWRSALPNRGLDEVYRHILRGDSTSNIVPMSWKGNPSDFTIENLKRYLREVLSQKGIGEKTNWLSRSTQFFRLDNAKPVCRFGLFMTVQNTKVDETHPGLMQESRTGYAPNYLTPDMWRGKHLRTIEHVAPQGGTTDWDPRFYENDNFQQVGNLTLLPARVNTSAGNRNWRAKWIYFSHLAEKDPDRLNELERLANSYGVQLNQDTIQLLRDTDYSHHIEPLVKVGIAGQWDLELVEARTRRICDLLWDRVWPWLT